MAEKCRLSKAEVSQAGQGDTAVELDVNCGQSMRALGGDAGTLHKPGEMNKRTKPSRAWPGWAKGTHGPDASSSPTNTPLYDRNPGVQSYFFQGRKRKEKFSLS